MRCQRCGSEFPEDSRFCPKCGTPLMEEDSGQPPASDHYALLQKYIPPELAKRILFSGKQIEGERRHVTVLFADVTGFTAMSEKLDSETVSTVLNDCFRGLISIILKYEGTIDKFIGDEIMAIFGAPLAHENDPERAVRCSLEMISYIERFNTLSPVQLPTPLSLHIGLHSGMVIAGNVGSDLRMNYSVIGDTVNLASRLVDLAPAGQVYLSSDTFKLVSGLVTADGPHPTSIKGKAELVNIYKLQSLRVGAEITKPAIRTSEFVGREKELALIAQSLDQVLQKKERRLFVRGEAGVGKTRLKDELLTLARSRNISTFEGKCSSFEIHTPYYLWNTLLKSLLRIGIDTTESETKIRLHDALQILSLEAHEPYLATLLSLRYEQILLEEDEHRKRKIFEAAREVLKAYAKRSPTVFILEDLHWIDRFSQELLEFIFAEESVAPALFFTLFRDEYTHAKKVTARGELIDLNRLSREEANNLMKSRLDVDKVPQPIEELVYKRSEGNPFFIEEILKTLQDKKVLAVKKRNVEILQKNIEAGVPETIQGVIMARIDRLEERIKQVLYGASVIGREFSRPILEYVVEKKIPVLPSLHELQSLELILEKEEAHELEYLFKHYLIQEVAYNTILHKKRRELHKLIAQAIEKLYAESLKEFYELLAFHYEKAEEWEKAAEYLSRAGRKVKEIYTKEESREFFERKDAAMAKLYESASEKRTGWMALGILTILIAAPIALLMLLMPIFLGYMLWNLPPYIEFELWGSEILGKVAFIVYFSILFFGYPWAGLLFTFFGVIPFSRGRPKSYDLMEDKLQVMFRNGKALSIPFSEINKLHFFDPKIKSARQWRYKILDPFYRVADYSVFSLKIWLKDVVLNILPPYPFGFGSHQGEIHIHRRRGANRIRLLLPWLNMPSKSQIITLSPSEPKEFFEQLDVTFTKWSRLQSKT